MKVDYEYLDFGYYPNLWPELKNYADLDWHKDQPNLFYKKIIFRPDKNLTKEEVWTDINYIFVMFLNANVCNYDGEDDRWICVEAVTDRDECESTKFTI